MREYRCHKSPPFYFNENLIVPGIGISRFPSEIFLGSWHTSVFIDVIIIASVFVGLDIDEKQN